jgi:5-methyltetrahydropteroyltriglutamate--homocysteine methyltransferase
MPFPTEPIGSIPRSAELIAAWGDRRAGHISTDRFQEIAERALRDTIRRFEDTGAVPGIRSRRS